MINLLLSSEPVYFSDTFEPFAIWGTVGIVGALLISWLIIFFTKKEIAGKVGKNMLIGFIFYALALGIFLLVLEITKKFDSAYLENNWVSKDIINYVFLPLLITTVIALGCAILLFVVSKKKPELLKTLAIIVGSVLFALMVACVVIIYFFYSNNIVGDGYYTGEEYGSLNTIALFVCALILVVATILSGLILGRKDKKMFDTKCITMAGVCVALSFALSYVKLFELPYGGSITLFSMLPVMLFAYVYGIKKGLLVGLLYGMLQAIQDPFIVHPAQFLLDYPIAFAMLGFAGSLTHFNVLSNKPRLKFTITAIIAGVLRWVSHVFSGVFAFGAYTLDAIYKGKGIFSVLSPASSNMANFWLYSTIYNAYVFIDVLLVIIVGIVLFSSKAFVKQVEQINPSLY